MMLPDGHQCPRERPAMRAVQEVQALTVLHMIIHVGDEGPQHPRDGHASFPSPFAWSCVDTTQPCNATSWPDWTCTLPSRNKAESKLWKAGVGVG